MTCLGQYHSGARECLECKIKARCKSIQMTDGLEIGAALLERLIEELPEGNYLQSQLPRVLVKSMITIKPPEELDKEQELLSLLEI